MEKHITLIGVSTTVIGFGLTGIKEIYEVNRRIGEEDLIEIIKKAKNKIILIDEELYVKIKEKAKKFDKIFVVIPHRYKEKDDSADIDEIVKDTLGVSVNI